MDFAVVRPLTLLDGACSGGGKNVAGYRVSAASLDERRIGCCADIFRIWASRMEAAPRRRIERARNFAGKLDPFGARAGIDHRDSGKQRPRIRVTRRREDFVATGYFDDPAQ